MIGQTLAHYGFEGLLGEGGSGVVYRGRDLRLERPVAIKVLADALRNEELAWARLLREARLASLLNHPNIAAIYDLGEEDGCAYIVMELVEGLPLADLIPDGGMPHEQFCRCATQICDALAYAHEHGTLHGDLKGSNIMVGPEGNIKLLDFGLGRRIPHHGAAEVSKSSIPLAQVGATSGTLPYLAPEVLRGSPTSMESDIWSLAVLFYQMITGDLPFQGTTPFDLSVAIMMSTPSKLLQIPEPLQSTLGRGLEKDPAARFQRVREFSRALFGSADGPEHSPESLPEPVISASKAPDALVSATATELGVAPRLARRSRKWWMAAASVAFGVLLMAGAYARHSGSPALRTAVVSAPVGNVRPPVAPENPDARVWVNTDSGTYHCPGTRWYGKTHEGKYMTQKAAKEKGYHPAAKHACT